MEEWSLLVVGGSSPPPRESLDCIVESFCRLELLVELSLRDLLRNLNFMSENFRFDLNEVLFSLVMEDSVPDLLRNESCK